MPLALAFLVRRQPVRFESAHRVGVIQTERMRIQTITLGDVVVPVPETGEKPSE